MTYEEAIRIPLIVSNPVLFPEPKTSGALVSLIDVMPTVAALAGVPNPENWQFKGVDFSSIILNGGSGEVQDTILFTYDDVTAGQENQGPLVDPPNRIRCIREKNWKYARYFDGDGQAAPEYEMYDLLHDSDELENLAHPEHLRYNAPEVVSQRNRLAQKLATLETEKLAPLSPTGIESETHPFPKNWSSGRITPIPLILPQKFDFQYLRPVGCTWRCTI